MESLLQQFLSGELSLAASVAWAAVALVLSASGGAATGVMLAGKDIGHDLAILLGGVYGATCGVPAALGGLLLLRAI